MQQTGSLLRYVTALAALALLGGSFSFAQVTTADILGRVTDATGAVVPSAKVTLVNTETNNTRSVDSSEGGDFAFTLLPPGRYSVRVEKSGFKAYTVPEILVAAGDRSRVNATMAVGQTTETVEVSAQAALLQTDSSSLGTSVSGRLVQDIPLSGRNYVQLTQMVAGVSSGPANGLATGSRPDDRRQNSSFSVNGQDPIANNNMIDGMDNNERFIGTVGVRPSIDAIQEFKVQTNLYTADVTRTSAGVVNILTKSGTNEIHGTLFEFFRNDKLDANQNYNFTGSPSGQLPPGEFRQNQFGGSVGGAIKKDKTFFFGDYEKLSIRQAIAISAILPTALQRVGDFSQNCTSGFDANGICGTASQQLQIANSVNGVPAGPVPFNRLNAAAYSPVFDPLGLKIASLYPLPTSSTVNGINYSSSPVRPQDQHTFDVRIDHRFSERTNFFSRYSFNNVSTFQPTGFPNVGGINPGGRFTGYSDFSGSNATRAQNIQLNVVHIFTPAVLLELKASFGRSAIQSRSVNDGLSAANTLGFPCNAASCVNIGADQTFGLPRLVIQGFQELGDATFVPLLQFDNTYQYNGAVSWTRGAHNMKFGASLIRRQFSLVQSASGRGTLTFNASTGTQPEVTNLGFANLLTGIPVTILRQASLYKPGYRAWEPGMYAQDDWRVNRWLTLNLGVRYDVFTPKVEQHDRLANFDPLTWTILVANQNGVNRAAGIQSDLNNIAPRIGFAATLGHGMVVRGGWGLSFFPMDYTSNAALKNLPFTTIVNCGPSVSGSFSNFACPAGVNNSLSTGVVPLPKDPASYVKTNGVVDLSQIPTSSVVAMSTDFPASKVQQFNVLVEKQFGANVVTAGYVGMRGSNIAMLLPDINRALPSGTNAAGTAANPSNPKPFASTPKISTIGYMTPQGDSEYDSLQISFNRRFSKGFSFTSSYTEASSHDDVTGIGTGTGGYANLVGPANTSAGLAQAIKNVQSYDWANSDFSIKRRFTFGGNYDLPFGKSYKGAMKQIVAGWTLNGFLSWQTGLPFTITDQSSVSSIPAIPGNVERPNLVSGQPVTLDNATVGSTGQYLNPAAFTVPAPGTLGNAPRNVAYGPRLSGINGSLFKTFDITERYHLQFRTEFFNIPNHPAFALPVGSVNSFGNGALYGKITSLAAGYPMREIQFALKLLF